MPAASSATPASADTRRGRRRARRDVTVSFMRRRRYRPIGASVPAAGLAGNVAVPTFRRLLGRPAPFVLVRGFRWRFGVSEVSRERSRRGSPLAARMRRADGRTAQLALRPDHAERDDRGHEAAGDPAGDGGDDDRAVEEVDVHFTYPLIFSRISRMRDAGAPAAIRTFAPMPLVDAMARS